MKVECINIVELGLDSGYAKDMDLVSYIDAEGANYISLEDAIAYVQNNSFIVELEVVNYE